MSCIINKEKQRMPDYGCGKIYTIRCRTDDTLIYVGSTIQSLAVRWGGHKKDSRSELCKNRLIYQTINGDWDNWYIELYELYPCSCVQELKRKEGEIIREIGTLNVRVEGRTKKEYQEEHKEQMVEWKKKWNEDNKEQVKEQNKERYEKHRDDLREKITCECGCIVCNGRLKKHQQTKKHLDLMEQLTN